MGKLKWSPYVFYTSSPQEFYYACKGYFDEKENDMMILRKVAYSFSGGSLAEFNNFWPVKGREVEQIEMDQAMKERILKIHNIKPDE